MVFQSGKSGNPAGRPTGAIATRTAARPFSAAIKAAQDEFIKVFPVINNLMIRAAIGEIELEKSQAWSIEKLLDRYLGKAFQSSEPLGLAEAENDEGSIPNMNFKEMQLLKNRMVAELIYMLYNNGKLKEIVNMIEGGWKPYEDEIVVEQLAIEEKK